MPTNLAKICQMKNPSVERRGVATGPCEGQTARAIHGVERGLDFRKVGGWEPKMVQPVSPPMSNLLGDVGGSKAVFIGAILGETGPEVPEIRMGRSQPARSLLI